MATADYVIVGAGSAGCVLAARLSEDPACEVILVEAGGEDDLPEIHSPINGHCCGTGRPTGAMSQHGNQD